MEVYLRLDDIDEHGWGCQCGQCNHKGRSYGVALINASTDEVEDRRYGPSGEAAENHARVLVHFEGWAVVGHGVRDIWPVDESDIGLETKGAQTHEGS